MVSSQYADLQAELDSNINVKDTLGGLPSRFNPNATTCGDWTGFSQLLLPASQLPPNTEFCALQYNTFFANGTYYIGILGPQDGFVDYTLWVFKGQVDLESLNIFGTGLPVRNAQRPTISNAVIESEVSRPFNYRYYEIDVDPSNFAEQSYLTVNISRATPYFDDYPVLRLHYLGVPQSPADEGDGKADDDDTLPFYPFCVDLNNRALPYNIHPTNRAPTKSCQCIPDVYVYENGATQLTCNVTVDPCYFQYGKWYASVELPPRNDPTDPLDESGLLNYTISAIVDSADVTTLQRNVTVKDSVIPEAATHYKISATDFAVGDNHLFVQISNVWVHQGLGPTKNIAGGPEACVSANATCRTCDACNIVVEKCFFVPGDWYISVNIVYDDNENRFLVENVDRLPATYTLRATWRTDPAVQPLLAGVPVYKSIGENLYDFYVVEVPPTVDTWLFVELYTKANDTEVILGMLHGGIPGGECYERPDFYCMTGDSRGATYETGRPQDVTIAPPVRESCTFMIQTCELEAGPLYLSVYGHRREYGANRGDNTFYQIPVEYTLWLDFDVALSLENSLSYTEHVFERQYNHYYIRADDIDQGSQLVIEATNIQHGIPPTIQVFVNYNFLAGDCPCYDHLFNCSMGVGSCPSKACDAQNGPPNNYAPQINSPSTPGTAQETVSHCCTIVVPPCDFRPGVWYIGVLGLNEDLDTYTTPIGYTLTATILPPPSVNGLILGQAATGAVPMFNRTYEYDHYQLAAEPIPLHNLVLELTYPQNCEYKPKHDNLRDSLTLYVNTRNIATQECSSYECTANLLGQSYCTIVIPYCEWSGADSTDYFLSVQGNYDSHFEARYTLRSNVEPLQEFQLTDGVAVHGSVKVGRYQHYALNVEPTGNENMIINMFSNSDQDRVTLSMNVNQRAGNAPCFDYLSPYYCEDVSCQWTISSCELRASRYYFSVFGGTTFQKQFFYNIPVDYTLIVSLRSVVTALTSGNPLMAPAHVNQLQHYSFVVGTPARGSFLQFEVDNVRHGAITAFANFANTDDDDNDLAGPCPCYKFDEYCVARGTTCDQDRTDAYANWCQIRVPPCQLVRGTYFFSVMASAYDTPVPFATTPVGYTVEAAIIPNVVTLPKVQRDRQLSNKLQFEFVQNNRYNHYQFDTDDDDSGYNIIVEINNIREGALIAYYRNGDVSDQDPACQYARICSTNGLFRGTSCSWQLPYCITSKGTHYVSIQGKTGRAQTVYDILIWKQRPLSVASNPLFDINALFLNNTQVEVDVVHDYKNEPNGWVQFVRLEDVQIDQDTEEGNILEVYFYRMQNNAGVPIKFNAYLWPEQPAGAGDCCSGALVPGRLTLDPDTRGSCQGMPCLNHVDTSTHVGPTGNGINVDNEISVTCDNGLGVGAAGGTLLNTPVCVLTVWTCDLVEYLDDDDAQDWWLTIVPDPEAINSDPKLPTLPGLMYSVAWKTSNIRTDAARTPRSTTDLTSSINTGFTTPFLVGTEPETYTSFSFDLDLEGDFAYLYVQAQSNQSALVYFKYDGFASPLDDCNDHVCQANGDCIDNDDSYLLQPCCTASGRYWITVRNQGSSDVPTSIQFNIGVQVHSSTVEIPNNPMPSPTSPFVDTHPSIASGNSISYRIELTEDDVSNHQRLNARLEMVNTTLPARYTLTMRRGFIAGSGRSDDDDLCFGSQYYDQTDDPEADATLDVPACQLVPGDWYITIENPELDLTTATELSEGYNFKFWMVPSPENLDPGLNQTGLWRVVDDRVLSVPITQWVGQTFRTNLDSNELLWGHRSPLLGYTTQYVQWLFTADFNSTLGGIDQISSQLRYDDIRGCDFKSYGAATCNQATNGGRTTATCYINVAPCTSEFELLTGDYYWDMRLEVNALSSDPNVRWEANYTAAVQILTYDFLEITPIVEDHPRGDDVSNLVFDVNGFLTTNNTVFYYAFDTRDYASDFVGADDDELSTTNYMTGYFTYTDPVSTTLAAGDVQFEVWRDDCTRFECQSDIASGEPNICVIDALTLAPCSVKGGRYYFKVELTSDGVQGLSDTDSVNFNFQWQWNQTHTDTIQLDIVHSDRIFADEYHELFLETDNTDLASTLTIDITSEGDTVEAWIMLDKPAGPGPDVNGCGKSCNLDYVLTTLSESDDGLWEGQLFIDVNDMPRGARGFWIAIRGVRETTGCAARFGDMSDFRCTEISYSVKAVQRQVQISQIESGSGACVNVNRLFEPLNQVPRQYVVEIDAIPAGSLLRFQTHVPNQGLKVGQQVITRVSFGKPVPYAYDDGSLLSIICEMDTDNGRTCVYQLDSCTTNQGTYYIWIDGPRGTELLVEKWSPVVERVLDNTIVSGTINSYPVQPLVFNADFMTDTLYGQNFAPPFQVYRVPIHATSRDYLVRAHLYGVQNSDQISMWINYGETPAYQNTASDCYNAPVVCTRPALADRNCTLFVGQEYFGNLWENRGFLPTDDVVKTNGPEQCVLPVDTPVCGPPEKLWLVVYGMEQTCQLHSMPYKVHVTTTQDSRKMKIAEPFCDSVEENQQNVYKLFPKFTPLPQETVIRVKVVGIPAGQQIQLGLVDGHVPSPSETDVSVLSSIDSNFGEATINWVCAFGKQQTNTYWDDDNESDNDDEGLYVQILGTIGPDDDDNDDDDDDEDEKLLPKDINYCLSVDVLAVNVIALEDDVRLEMDDDDDACPGIDYFRISTTDAVNGYFELSVISEGEVSVTTNIGGLPGDSCQTDAFEFGPDPADDDDDTEHIWRDFCRYSANQDYYFAVETNAKYSIMGRTVDDVTRVDIGEALDDVVRVGQLKTYEIRVRDTEPDDRLSIMLENVYFNQVAMWVRRGGFTGPRQQNGIGEILEGADSDCTIAVGYGTTAVGDSTTGYKFATRVIGTDSGDNNDHDRNLGYGFSTVPATCLQEASYYVTVMGVTDTDDDDFPCRSPRFTIRPELYNLELALEELESNVILADEGLDYPQIGRYDSINDLPRHRFYRIEVSGVYGKANLFQVEGGSLRLDVKADHLALQNDDDDNGYIFSGQREGLQDLWADMTWGTLPFTSEEILNSDLALANRASEESCITGCAQSCVLWIDQCEYSTRQSYYLAVGIEEQNYIDNDITYSIRFNDNDEPSRLLPNSPRSEEAFPGLDMHFFRIEQDVGLSMRVQVKVDSVSGDGSVHVVIQNDFCSDDNNKASFWQREFFCTPATSDDGFDCQFELPAHADHPGCSEFYVIVSTFGDASFSIRYLEGRENCHSFTGKGISEGLGFCRGLPYSTWSRQDWAVADQEAECLFTQLYEQFRVQPCWSGVTPECNDTLQRFACYETFRRCDDKGFIVGTCREACDNVVYQCANYFESVNLEHYNCSSSRYLEASQKTCTGNNEMSFWGEKELDFNIDDILYKSAPAPSTSSDDDSSRSTSAANVQTAGGIMAAIVVLAALMVMQV